MERLGRAGPSADTSLDRRSPALDGIRGLSIMIVLLIHAHVRYFHGTAIEAFFVLSGMVITSLLLRAHKGLGRLPIASFYRDRALRLFPVLFVMLLISGFALVLLGGRSPSAIWQSTWPALTYTTNVRLVLDHSFDPAGYTHLWTLSVEEQFYILWPLCLALILRSRRPLRLLLWATGAAFLISLISRAWEFDPHYFLATYVGTPGRVDSLLAGCSLALALRRLGDAQIQRYIRPVVTFGCYPALAFIFFMVGFDVDSQKTGVFKLYYVVGPTLTTLAMVVIIAAALVRPQSIIMRFFATRGMARLGLMSYSLYVWHGPVFYLVSHNLHFAHNRYDAVISISVALAVAGLSYRFIEEPCMRYIRRAQARDRTSFVETGHKRALAQSERLLSRETPQQASMTL